MLTPHSNPSPVPEVYFDNCALQRPLDPPVNARIRLEAEAVLSLIEIIEAGQLALTGSEVLEFEIHRTPDPEQMAAAKHLLKHVKRFIRLSAEMLQAAAIYEKAGVRPLDALHLAVAHEGRVDYLCTCDDRFLKTAHRITGLQTCVISPLHLIQELQP